MKTIKDGLDKAYKNAGHNAYFGNGFEAGVNFAQRWIPVIEEKPLAYEIGYWDGQRSDVVLVKQNKGIVLLARAYEGYIDGNKFYDFVDNDGNIIINVTSWRYIEYK